MQCPTCKNPIDEPTGDKLPPHFPFCSERCKLIDLGRWLDGKYQIPVVEPDEGDSDPADSDAPEL